MGVPQTFQGTESHSYLHNNSMMLFALFSVLALGLMGKEAPHLIVIFTTTHSQLRKTVSLKILDDTISIIAIIKSLKSLKWIYISNILCAKTENIHKALLTDDCLKEKNLWNQVASWHNCYQATELSHERMTDRQTGFSDFSVWKTISWK